MATIKVPYLVRRRSGFYWQPNKAVRAMGFKHEALGKDRAAAIARAQELYREVESRKGVGDFGGLDPSSAEYRELKRLVEEDRLDSREFWIRQVVRAAEDYAAELKRSDGFHGARLSQREHRLTDAIDECHRALHPGPITRHAIEHAKANRELKRRSSEIAMGPGRGRNKRELPASPENIAECSKLRKE